MTDCKTLSRSEKAKNYFLQGYNCTQAVSLAFADELPVDSETLLKIASSFGGGMGRLREVCGAVSGMFIVMGLISGYATPETGLVKTEHYRNIQELAHRFEQKNGNIVCRELLGLKQNRQDATPEPRTREYYEKRPCPDLVASAAAILEEYIQEQKGT